LSELLKAISKVMDMHDSDLQGLLAWAGRLPGKQLQHVARLLDDPDDRPTDINRSFEPLVFVVEGDEPTFLTVDEGKGNLLIRPYAAVRATRPPVFGDYVPVDVDGQPLIGSSSLDSFGVIKSVAALSLHDHDLPADYFSVCGLQFTSESGVEFSVGTHLTELRLAGLWLVPASELAPAVQVRRL
jgi:hypothetical protein